MCVLSRLLRSGKDDVLQERVVMCDIRVVATWQCWVTGLSEGRASPTFIYFWMLPLLLLGKSPLIRSPAGSWLSSSSSRSSPVKRPWSECGGIILSVSEWVLPFSCLHNQSLLSSLCSPMLMVELRVALPALQTFFLLLFLTFLFDLLSSLCCYSISFVRLSFCFLRLFLYLCQTGWLYDGTICGGVFVCPDCLVTSRPTAVVYLGCSYVLNTSSIFIYSVFWGVFLLLCFEFVSKLSVLFSLWTLCWCTGADERWNYVKLVE